MADHRTEASMCKFFVKMQWDEYLKTEGLQGIYKN